MSGREEIDPRMVKHLVSQYDGEIAHLDAQLGDFLDALREAGVYDRSWIVMTSDHGEHFGERGLLWHRTSLYDELLRVPLIVKAPGQTVGRRETGTVQPSDLMPTLLRANGIEPPAVVHARGLDKSRDRAFAEVYHDRWIVENHGEVWARDLVTYERAGRKLVLSSRGEVEVYDAGRRPAKPRTTNEDVPEPDEAQLRQEFEALIAELPGPPGEGRSEGPAKDTLRRLRELGYVE
jgi:arylsulfatase A-like enzyme